MYIIVHGMCESFKQLETMQVDETKVRDTANDEHHPEFGLSLGPSERHLV